MSSVRPLRILTFTTLYPSDARPRHGIFVETRVRQLIATGRLQARVLAPVPWFPLRSGLFGQYGALARTPQRETRNAIAIEHPRYLMIPKFGMHIQPASLARAALPLAREAVREGLDLIDSHYFYPDGVAASILSSAIGIPFTITARGSDINLIGTIQRPRIAMLAAANNASALISVSCALRDAMVKLGMPSSKITVLRNGVDAEIFRPNESARAALGIAGSPLLLSVGNLVPEKGHALAIESLLHLPREAVLVIVGEGPERGRLQQLAMRDGLSGRVHFLANRPQHDLAEVYAAADCLILASSREGWPNVLLEAMACGTPVVATAVGGVREIVREAVAGRVIPERTPQAIASAVLDLRRSPTPRAAVRAYASSFGWDDIAREQIALFERVCAR